MLHRFEGQVMKFVIWLLLLFTVIFLILYIILGESIHSGIANRAVIATGVFAGVGIIIAFVQASWASHQAEKASQQTKQMLTTNILFSLCEMYSQRDMHRAIKTVWQAMKQEGRGVSTIGDLLEITDRYQFLKKWIEEQAKEGKEKELDESRRMVTHFWYLIANLLNQDMIQEQDVFEWFGPPDVIWVLEGLEVIQQNLEMMGGHSKTKWPPLQVLEAYYKSNGINIKVLGDVLIPIVRIEPETISEIKKLWALEFS